MKITGSIGHQQKPTHSTPTIRELGTFKMSDEYQWYNLGVQLGIDVHYLDWIEEKYPRSCKIRQNKMFGEWLRRDPEASWDKLCGALRIVGEEKVIESIISMHGTCVKK